MRTCCSSSLIDIELIFTSLFDYDTTKDRENDIRFHDKTEYDLKMAKVTADYKDFVERMTDVAIESIDKINESVGKINDKKCFVA